MWRLIVSAGLCLVFARVASSTRLVCYYNCKSEDRKSEAKFKVKDIETDICTHLMYGCSRVNEEFKLVPVVEGDEQNYKSFNSLKKKSTTTFHTLLDLDLKLDPDNFRAMASSSDNRNTFTASAVLVLEKYNFDGLNVNWEYNDQSQSGDKDLFTELCKALKQAFDAQSDTYLLTASVSAVKSTIDNSYDITQIVSYLDFINVLTYDFYDPSGGVTRHHSPLYRGDNDSGDQVYYNADYAMQYWRDQGAPTDKLNLGLAVHGRAFTLSSDATNVGAPASGRGEEGCYTGEAGFWAYFETCIYREGVTDMLLTDQKVPYAAIEDQWVGFDDKDSVKEKANYVRNNNYGGVFVSSLDMDDFKGQFCNQGNFPLTKHVKNILFV